MADRARLLLRVAELIDARSDELAALEALDAGKPIRDCLGLMEDGAQEFAWFSDVAQKMPGAAYPVDANVHSYSTVEAYGVIAGITPWNFPLNTAISKVAPALAMGNTFILKPAEQTPLTALAFAEICAEAGLPDGTIAVLPGGPDTGSALAAHPGVPFVSFTGSTEVGRLIARGAADRIQRVLLELGGKSPVLVFDDAPLEAMAAATLDGFTQGTGQICVASTRLITTGLHPIEGREHRPQLAPRISAFDSYAEAAARKLRKPRSEPCASVAGTGENAGWARLPKTPRCVFSL